MSTLNTHYYSHQVTLQNYIQADLQRNQSKYPKLQLNSLLSLARETEREETKDRRTPTLFPGLQNSVFYTFYVQFSCNLNDESGQNATEGRDKKKMQ